MFSFIKFEFKAHFLYENLYFSSYHSFFPKGMNEDRIIYTNFLITFLNIPQRPKFGEANILNKRQILEDGATVIGNTTQGVERHIVYEME